MFNPILLLQMWKYYHYYALGISVYSQINSTGKAVTYTGRALYNLNRFIRGRSRSDRSDQRIIELMEAERRRKALTSNHTDEWEIL